MDKENKVEKSIEKGKLSKYKLTRKSWYSLASIFVAFLLIVVLSLTSAVYDPKKLTTVAYWVNVALSSAICIFGMISGQKIGDDMSRNDDLGQFRRSLKKYSESYENIEKKSILNYFEDWLDLYRQKRIKKKIARTLRDASVYQLEVLDLDLNELSNLKTPYRKDWTDTYFYDKYYKEKTGKSETIFLSYTDEQIEVIRECKTGHVTLSPLPASFFLDALSTSEKDMWESSAHAGQKKNAYMASGYAYRILSLVAVSMVFAGLGPDLYDEYNAASIAINLISRIFSLVTAVVWGMYLGIQLVKIDVSYVEFKISILTLYYDEFVNQEYVPESIEERAKKEYEEYEKNKPIVDIVKSDTDGITLLGNDLEEGLVDG